MPKQTNGFLRWYKPAKYIKTKAIVLATIFKSRVTIAEITKITAQSERTVKRYLKELQDYGALRREWSG